MYLLLGIPILAFGVAMIIAPQLWFYLKKSPNGSPPNPTKKQLRRFRIIGIVCAVVAILGIFMTFSAI